MQILIYSVLFLCFLTSSSYACSFVPVPVYEVEKDEYIFTGKVVGYTAVEEFESRKSDNNKINSNPQWFYGSGVIIEVIDFVHPLNVSEKKFEVFRYTVDGACRRLGIFQTELEIHYPLNSKVMVVGKPATLVNEKSESVIPRLEIALVTGSLTKSFGDLPAIDSVADYKNLHTSLEKFEIRKDLLRLANTSDHSETRAILKRMIEIPRGLYKVDLIYLIHKYIPEKQIADKMYQDFMSHSGHDQKIIDFHLNCVQELIKNKKIVPGKLRC